MSYTDDSGTDGTGAQVFRYAISYSLCKEFSLRWRHRPITRIDDNPSDSFSEHSAKKKYLEQLNTILRPNDSIDYKPILTFTVRKTLSNFQLKTLLKFFRKFRMLPPLIDFSLYRPQHYLQTIPINLNDYFDNMRSHFRNSEMSRKNLKLVVHIRGALRTDRRTNPLILKQILSLLQTELSVLGYESSINIITDLPRKSMSWKFNENNDPGTIEYWKSLGLINVNGEILLDSYDFEAEFANIKNLQVNRQLNPIELWELMTNAHLLIGCDSSLSIIGSYLNNSGVNFLPSTLRNFVAKSCFFYSNSREDEEINRYQVISIVETLRKSFSP